MEDEVH